ncbi:MAG: putative minor capsid protein [Muricomes sp.]
MMVISKPPIESLVDAMVYEQISGKDDYQRPTYAEPVTISNVRIDRNTKYTYTPNGRVLIYNAIIFCYAGLTTPMKEFITESRVTFGGNEHIITNVLKNYEPYSGNIYSVELEVV